MATKPELVVIVGETTSGKSAVALELAQKVGGEIICADSRTVYKGMDIGTAKPTKAEQELVPHHLLDVVEPDQGFSAANFKELANRAIDDIKKRGKVPIIVGGTGLYADAVLFDYDFRPVADAELRQQLNSLDITELQKRIIERGWELPSNSQNPHHLIRVLESEGETADKKPLREDAVIYGIELDREMLRQRVNKRTRQMIKEGLFEEAEGLIKLYGWEAPGLNAIGYRELKPYFEGMQTQEQTVLDINRDTLQYAKRQRTWFKRNKRIQWVTDPNKIVDIATTELNK